jgi:hypothetical protein
MAVARLILDTNLLLLLVVGMASPRYIAKHKRLHPVYTIADFDLLSGYVRAASHILLTPNTLTETSNLARQIAEPARSEIGSVLRQLVLTLDETYVNSASGVGQDEFIRLGLTDSVLLSLASPDVILLTADVGLYVAACSRGMNAQNFNHLRGL